MYNRLVKTIIVAAFIFILIVGCVKLGATDSLMILALPFTMLGKGLRFLSLSGTVGNIISIVLFVLFSLLPFVFKLKGNWRKEDVLLPICSVMMLYVVYYMINPANRPITLTGDVGDLILSGAVYSVLLSWVILKLMQNYDSMSDHNIYMALRIFIGICAVDFVLAIAVGFVDFQTNITAIKEANTITDLNLNFTFVFVFFSFAVTAVEYILDILILCLAIRLFKELDADPYNQNSYQASLKLSNWCKRSLILLTITNTIQNIGLIILSSKLHSLAVHFRLPVLSLAIAFALLALTRLLYQGKQIKDDNDLFI